MKQTRILFLTAVIVLSMLMVGIGLAADASPHGPAGVDVVSTDYGWSQATGTYTPIAGGTVLTTSCDDDNFNANTIPFSFTFNGVAYTSVSIQCNGFIAMGPTISSSYTPLSTGSSNNVVSALGGDLQTNTADSEIRIETVGTAPNQVFVIQWKNFKAYGTTGAGDTLNFQIRLYETTNLVEIVYGDFVQNATSRTRQVGLRGDTSADFNNRKGTAEWTNSLPGTVNSDSMALTTAFVPPSGLTWDWTVLAPHPVLNTSFKTATAEVLPGAPINYSITIINSGLGDATDTSLVDPLPAGTIYNDDVACTSGVCSFDGTQVLWNGSIPAAGQVVVTFSATPEGLVCGDLVVNSAVINDPGILAPVNVSASTELVNTFYYTQDFEANDGGYTNAGANPWSWGLPPAGLAPAHSGVNVWATQSPYVASSDYQLISPWLDLSVVDPDFDLVLNWWQKLDVEVGYDYAYVDISTDGVLWQNLWTGNYHGGWEKISVDITPFTGLLVQLRFHMTSDSSVQYNGWAIDDIAIRNGCISFIAPDIAVAPASINQQQLADVVSTVPLTITNNGNADLIWSIDEFQSFSLVSNPSKLSTPVSGQSLSSGTNGIANIPSKVMKTNGNNPNALINDGSFEFGPPPASAWTEVSDTGCEWIGDFSSIFGVPSFDGVNTFWAGGYCGTPNSDYVNQLVTVPTGDTTLSFWYLAYRPNLDDPEFPDYMYVSVDGTTVWTLDLIQANNTFPNYVNATVDLSAYAGQEVLLEFGGVSAGTTTGNALLDFIEFVPPAICSNPVDVSWLAVAPSSGTTAPESATPIEVSIDSTGLTTGAYNADLCVHSNDPDEPLVIVPVGLTVVGEGPIISVTPPSLSASLLPGQTTVETLNIANLGSQDLVWDIAEGVEVVGFSENFDSYLAGSQMHGQGGWKGWGNVPGAGALVSDVQSHSAPNSVDINGASDLVHEYSGYTSGVWTYTAWQYVPTDFSGMTYFILLNQYDDAGINLNWSTQVSFDSVTGLVSNTGGGFETTPLITGEWVELRVVIDLNANLQTFYYGSTLLYTMSWTEGISGGGILNIAAVDLFANLATTVYYDDISLVSPATDIPWLSEAPTSGTTAPAGSSPVDVTFDSTGLTPGTYNATLLVNSNDPVQPVVEVPVTLEVTGAAAITVDPTSLEASLMPDTQETQDLNVCNVGSAPLDWTLTEVPGLKGAASTVQYPYKEVAYWDRSETAPAGLFHGIGVDTWGTGAVIPTGNRYRAAGTSCDGTNYYLFGGQNGSGIVLNESWMYDPVSDAWTSLAPMQVGLMGLQATCLDGKIYLVGGYTGAAHTNNFQIYDIASDTWTLTTWPNARTPMTAAAGGMLYAFGGNPGPSGETWSYDPVLENWTMMASMPTANSYGAAITVGNYIYQIGGGLTNTVQRYDPANNTWDNAGPQLQNPRMSAVTVWYGDFIYVISGGGSGGDYWTGWDTTEVYNPSLWPAGAWSNDDEPVPTPVVGAAGDCAADSAWAAGGTSAAAYFDTNQYLNDGLTCNFTPVVGIPWLSEAPTSGTLDPGTCEVINVTFDSTGLALGTYHGSLDISSNDPVDPVVNVPVTLNVVEPDIVVAPTSLAKTLMPNEIGTLSFNIDNIGEFPLDWSVTDGATWLSELPTSGQLAPGTSIDVVATFNSDGLLPGEYTTTIVVASNDPQTPEVSIDVTLTVTALGADLSVVKTGNPGTVRVGDNLTYTLVVTNTGPDDAVGVMLVDTLPTLVEFVSASNICTNVGGVVTCDIGDLAMGDSVTVTVVVTAIDEGIAENTAVVSSEFVDDPNPDNNTSTVSTIINPATFNFFLPLVQKN